MRLINAIKVQTQCESDGELRNLPVERKKRLADSIEERVPSGLATLAEWNEVLACFGAEDETDNESAKDKLLMTLREDKE